MGEIFDDMRDGFGPYGEDVEALLRAVDDHNERLYREGKADPNTFICNSCWKVFRFGEHNEMACRPVYITRT